jgi:hypothetical protein
MTKTTTKTTTTTAVEANGRRGIVVEVAKMKCENKLLQ